MEVLVFCVVCLGLLVFGFSVGLVEWFLGWCIFCCFGLGLRCGRIVLSLLWFGWLVGFSGFVVRCLRVWCCLDEFGLGGSWLVAEAIKVG